MSGTIVPKWIAQAKPYVGALVKAARDRTDPEERAAFVVEKLLPGYMIDEIAEASKADTFVADALAAVPELQAADVEPWARKFLEAVQAIMRAAENADELEDDDELEDVDNAPPAPAAGAGI